MNRKEYIMPDGKRAIFEYDHDGVGKITLEAMDALMGMIVDRPQGVWKAKSFHEFICDNCGFSFDVMKCDFLENMKYCPNCGVRKGADDEYGDVEYDDIVAWMPLPKPYGEREGE